MSDHIKITTQKNGVETVQEFQVLAAPLTEKDTDADGWVKGVVSLDAGFLIRHGDGAVLDKLSELLVGNDLLMDFDYRVVGLDPENEDHLYIEVSGDANAAFHIE